MKQNRIRKCLRAAALAVVALILVLAGTVFALWHNEFATLGSSVSYTHLTLPTILLV